MTCDVIIQLQNFHEKRIWSPELKIVPEQKQKSIKEK